MPPAPVVVAPLVSFPELVLEVFTSPPVAAPVVVGDPLVTLPAPVVFGPAPTVDEGVPVAVPCPVELAFAAPSSLLPPSPLQALPLSTANTNTTRPPQTEMPRKARLEVFMPSTSLLGTPLPAVAACGKRRNGDRDENAGFPVFSSPIGAGRHKLVFTR